MFCYFDIYFFFFTPIFHSNLLQGSVSHYLAEIILICWSAAHETFIIIINDEKFCGNHDFFFLLFLIFFTFLKCN